MPEIAIPIWFEKKHQNIDMSCSKMDIIHSVSGLEAMINPTKQSIMEEIHRVCGKAISHRSTQKTPAPVPPS